MTSYLRSLVARFFHRSQTEDDMEEELRSHIQCRVDDLERSGLGRGEAERRARIEFGSHERFKEECREAIAGNFFDTLIQDVRFSLRMLRKSPGFTAIAVLTIALGIGATTAIFSVFDATLLHPLPYPQPEQLVSIEDDLPGVGAQDVGMSEPEWQDFQHSGIFESVSPTWYDDNNLTGSSKPARVSLLIVAPDYFALLGVKPQLGRAFNPEDHRPGFTEEVVISDAMWKRDFASDPQIVGKSVRMDTDLYRIIGIMPPGFQAPGRTTRDRNIEIWAATSFYGAPLADQPPRSGRNLPTAIARLKPGLTIAAAQSRIDALVASLQKQFPGDYPVQARWTVRLLPLKETVVGNVRQSLFLMLGAVGLVLVIGCVNIANLMLARASARGREMAIRQALGAGRRRLTRQLVTESLFLSLLGAIAGLAFLFFTKDFLVQLIPESLPRLNDISISWGVLLFALGVSLVAGVIFGLAPALHAGRLDVTHMLKLEGRALSGSRQQSRTRRVLVVAEFALSLVLMITASLLLRSFWDLLNVPLGFNPGSVMTVKTRMPYPNDPKTDLYGTASQQAPFFREILRRSRTLSGVKEAAVGDLGAIPLGHDRNNQNPPVPLILEGREAQSNGPALVDESIVTPEYFHLMGMTLQRGRLLSDFDSEKAPEVAVINEAMAQTYWPNEDPLGKHLKVSRRATSWTTVVGIIADARAESLEEAQVPEVYTSLYQRGAHHLAIFLRGHFDTAAIPDEVREQVQSVDPTLPVFGAQMLNETVSASLAQRRFLIEIVALFALTALLLAGLGIYGVISYIVSERTHEIGIRLALGAEKRSILQMVMGQGLGLAVAGTAIGLVGAAVVSHLMTGLLYGVRPTDPLTFAAVALLLIAVALLACYFPARRALNIDPVVALRTD
ncbi:MAG: putative transport system permease protein [Verrucomicrobiota bacterium]|jgi:putative ABC transport system permease protein